MNINNNIESLRSLSQIFSTSNFNKVVRKKDYDNTFARIEKHTKITQTITNNELLNNIYNKLLDLRSGKIDNYGVIKQSDIYDATDEALINLASSWGPFQLMGYKCIQLGINIGDIRGKDTVYWGIKWIDITYGDYLRNYEYENAFHIHNTGIEYPVDGNVTTSNPDYVKKGLQYMKYF